MPRSLEAGAPPAPELSRPVAVAKLTQSPARYEIEASESELLALAHRLGLVSLSSLTAVVSLARLRGSTYELSATLRASVVQNCVVTLEPFEALAADQFTLLYRPRSDAMAPLADADEEEVEFLDGDTIDIGEAVAQQLSLIIDPYPRAAGATVGWIADH